VNQRRQQHAPTLARALAAAALFALPAALHAPAQAPAARGPLSEIKDRRRAALLVSRAHTVDARDPSRAALDSYRRALAGDPPRPHAAGYRSAARGLNKYIRKYRSLSAVDTVGEADFVILFNVLRARRSFIPEEPFVFGKLFVIARPTVAGTPPRVVWESEGDESSVEDALGDFLKALRALRGER